MRVLIADDNADMLIMLQLWLEADGHTVHMVASGSKVVAAVRDVRPDACVIDIRMPGASGLDVARSLRELHGARCPHLIALSGSLGSDADRQLARDAGFNDFLEKPADPRRLSSILQDLARRRASAAPARLA